MEQLLSHLKPIVFAIASIVMLTCCANEKSSSLNADSSLPSLSQEEMFDLIGNNTPSDLPPGDHIYIDAGSPQYADSNLNIVLRGEALSLDDSEITQVLWRQVEGPAVQITNPDRVIAGIVTPVVSEPLTLGFQLIAANSNHVINADTTTITVLPTRDGASTSSTSSSGSSSSGIGVYSSPLGVWQFHETSDETDCGTGIVEYEYIYEIEQTGDTILAHTTVDNSTPISVLSEDFDFAEWTGEHQLDGGILSFTGSASVDTPETFLGDTVWSWESSTFSCEGTSTLQGRCLSGACKSLPTLAGEWEVTEVSDNTECGEGFVTETYRQIFQPPVSESGAAGIYPTVNTFEVTQQSQLIQWEGQQLSGQGVVRFELELALANELANGESTWEWVFGESTCSGRSTIMAQCLGGACVIDPPQENRGSQIEL